MSFVSQKGGTGKSTFVRAAAIAASGDDMNVKIGDLDIRQGTTMEWSRFRLQKGLKPAVSVEFFKSAAAALSSVNSDLDLLLIDGPARASTETHEIARNSHLIIQPTGPSHDDLKPSVLLFHELVKKGISKDRMVMVLNRVGTEVESNEALEYISDAGYKALNEFIFEKPAYRQAQNNGLTILETRFPHLNQSAENVINALIKIILGQVKDKAD
jgi:chromosome partitioning protein